MAHEPEVAIVQWQCSQSWPLSLEEQHSNPQFEGCGARHVILPGSTWSRKGVPVRRFSDKQDHSLNAESTLVECARCTCLKKENDEFEGDPTGAVREQSEEDVASGDTERTELERTRCREAINGNDHEFKAQDSSMCVPLHLSVIEDVHSSGPGGRIWDAAVVLAEFLVCRFAGAYYVESGAGSREEECRYTRSSEEDCAGPGPGPGEKAEAAAAAVTKRGVDVRVRGMSGLDVVELGAGTGLAGIVASLLGACVCITDKDYVVPLIETNVRRNLSARVGAGEVRAASLSWGQKLGKRLKRRRPHLILASDVVGCGDEALYPPLLKTLLQLSGPTTVAIMTYKPRAPFERLFFAAAREHFSIRRVARGILPPDAALEIFSSVVEVLVFLPLDSPWCSRGRATAGQGGEGDGVRGCKDVHDKLGADVGGQQCEADSDNNFNDEQAGKRRKKTGETLGICGNAVGLADGDVEGGGGEEDAARDKRRGNVKLESEDDIEGVRFWSGEGALMMEVLSEGVDFDFDAAAFSHLGTEAT